MSISFPYIPCRQNANRVYNMSIPFVRHPLVSCRPTAFRVYFVSMRSCLYLFCPVSISCLCPESLVCSPNALSCLCRVYSCLFAPCLKILGTCLFRACFVSKIMSSCLLRVYCVSEILCGKTRIISVSVVTYETRPKE